MSDISASNLMDKRVREAAEADINTLFQNLSGQDQFLMTKFLDNMVGRMERMEDDRVTLKQEREEFEDKVDGKLDRIMTEVRSYSELNSSLISKTNNLEKVTDQVTKLVMSHEKSINQATIYLKELHADMKKHPLADMSKDIDAAHDKLREHDRIMTNLHGDMKSGFEKMSDKIDKNNEILSQKIAELAGKPGKNAIKAWHYVIGIGATAGITWLVTNLLNGNIQIGG